MRTRRIEVEEGEVRLSSIEQLHRYPNVEVWEIDSNSKYLGIGVTESRDGSPALMLFADDRTIKLDESRRGQATWITWHGRPGWSIVAEGGRYSYVVTLYRHQRARGLHNIYSRLHKELRDRRR